jgi:hypothetical protein
MAYSYEIGLGFAGTGTATVTRGSANVTGAGTDFTAEFKAGYLIEIASEWRVVSAVTSGSTLTVSAPWGTSGSAQAIAGASLTNVTALTTPVPAPKSAPRPWVQAVALGSGRQRAQGKPLTVWNFSYLTRAQRDQLRTFCPGKSANVYIRSRGIDQADAYQYCQAIMLWPDEEARDSLGYRVPLAVTFQFLIPLTVS